MMAMFTPQVMVHRFIISVGEAIFGLFHRVLFISSQYQFQMSEGQMKSKLACDSV